MDEQSEPRDTLDSGARDTGDAPTSDAGPRRSYDVPPGFLPVPDGSPDTRYTSDPEDGASYLFDPSEVRSYDLRLSPESLAFLDADPRAEVYVEGELGFEGQTYGPVGIRYKGSVGAFRTCVGPSGEKTCRKISMKVKINWSDPDRTFFGVKKLQFHGLHRDPSKLRERLGYWMYRAFDVPAPRAVHARLSINGAYVGVVALIEQIDGRFTRSRFRDGKGNLYKEVWPLTSGGQAIDEASMMEGLRTNEDEMPSFDRFRRFGEAVAVDDVAERVANLQRWTDHDLHMRYIAVDRTQANDDGIFHWYCGGAACSNHNFYWYEEAEADRVWLIPWDLDGTFNLDNAITTIAIDWEDISPGCGGLSGAGSVVPLRVPVCDKVLQAWASQQSRYLEQVALFLDGPFSPDAVEQQLSEAEAQILPHLMEEAALHADTSIEGWNAARAQLRATIETLRARALSRLQRGEHMLWALGEPVLDAGVLEDDGGI